jgi:hypothetical protein
MQPRPRPVKAAGALLLLLVAVGAHALLTAPSEPPPPRGCGLRPTQSGREVPLWSSVPVGVLAAGLGGLYVWLSSRLAWNGALLAAGGYLLLVSVWLFARIARTAFGPVENKVRVVGGAFVVAVGLAVAPVGFWAERGAGNAPAIPEWGVVASSLTTVVASALIEAVALFWAAPRDARAASRPAVP